jgi:outer membrane protein
MGKQTLFYSAMALLVIAMQSLCASHVFAQDGPTSVSLQQAYQSAVVQLERVGVTEERLTQAESRYKQARGMVLPQIDFMGAYQRQQPRRATGTAAAFAINEQTTLRLAARQPLFQGFRDFGGLAQAKKLAQAAEADKKDALRLVYSDLAQVYFSVMSLEKEKENLDEQVRLVQVRRKELEGRRRIGRSRAAEVLAVDAREKSLQAELAQLRGRLAAARESLAFMTGLPATIALKEDLRLPSRLPPLETLVNSSGLRSDVVASHLREEAADKAIIVARGGHLPSAELAGNYFFKRPGVLQQVKWDVTLSFTMPLFQGGAVFAATAEAAAAAHEAALVAAESRRRAKMEVTSFYENLSALMESLKLLKESLELSQENYKVQSQEYRLGLVSNIEVLQSLDAYTNAQRSYIVAQYLALAEYVRLQAAAGNVREQQQGAL